MWPLEIASSSTREPSHSKTFKPNMLLNHPNMKIQRIKVHLVFKKLVAMLWTRRWIWEISDSSKTGYTMTAKLNRSNKSLNSWTKMKKTTSSKDWRNHQMTSTKQHQLGQVWVPIHTPIMCNVIQTLKTLFETELYKRSILIN